MTIYKSDSVKSIENTPQTIISDASGHLFTMNDRMAVSTDIMKIGDVFLFGAIPSFAVITELKVRNKQFDSGTPTLSVSWGLYYSGRGGNQTQQGKVFGTVINDSVFGGSDTTLRSDNPKGIDLRFKDAGSLSFSNVQAWKLGGLGVDPGGLFYIGFIVQAESTQPGIGGSIVLEVRYI